MKCTTQKDRIDWCSLIIYDIGSIGKIGINKSKTILGWLTSILNTWMVYIVLSFTGFSSSNRGVGIFYSFITLTFCLFLSITFENKVLLRTILVHHSMTGVNNAQ